MMAPSQGYKNITLVGRTGYLLRLSGMSLYFLLGGRSDQETTKYGETLQETPQTRRRGDNKPFWQTGRMKERPCEKIEQRKIETRYRE